MGRNSWPGRDSGLHIGARTPLCPHPTFLQLLPRALGVLRLESRVQKHQSMCQSPPCDPLFTHMLLSSLMSTCFYSYTSSSLASLLLFLSLSLSYSSLAFIVYIHEHELVHAFIRVISLMFGAMLPLDPTTGPMSSLRIFVVADILCVHLTISLLLIYVYIYRCGEGMCHWPPSQISSLIAGT